MFRMTCIVLLGLVLVGACGGSSAPVPVPPADRTATAETSVARATASAEAALRRKPPCVLNAETRHHLRQLTDSLWRIGSEVGDDNPTRGHLFFQASIAYGILSDCRETAGTPVPNGSPTILIDDTPTACPTDPDVIDQLRDAAGKGTAVIVQLMFTELEPEAVVPTQELNDLLMQRAADVEAKCGFQPPASSRLEPLQTESWNRSNDPRNH
jgi:hypothetical protein